MQRTSRIRKRWTSAQRAEILEKYRQSRLTQREFTEQAGMSVSTLQLWLKKAPVAQGLGRSEFVQVPHWVSAPPTPATYRLQFPEGLILEIRSGFPAEELGWLLQKVQGI